MTKLSFAIFAAMMAFSAFAQNVATVNGKPITRKQFDEYHLQNLKFVGQRKITKEVSLQDLINRELAIQKAKKTGLDKDPQVIAKQEDILYYLLESTADGFGSNHFCCTLSTFSITSLTQVSPPFLGEM